MRTVRPHERRNLDAVDDGVEAGADVRLCADGIDACVSTPPIGKLLDLDVDVFLLKIECDGAGGLRQGETLRDSVDGDHAFCTQKKRALDRKLPYGTATPHRHRLAALQIAEISGHEARGEYIRQEEDLFVA